MFNSKKNQKGLTLLEALVSTAIIGIGFVAIFQMVNYSVRSTDVSGERTKANFLASMVAEDLLSEKSADSPTTGTNLRDYLTAQTASNTTAWSMGSCSTGSTSTGTAGNAFERKKRKWDNRFSTRRLRCSNAADQKHLKVYDICNNSGPGTCNYNNTTIYGTASDPQKVGLFDQIYLGRMEVNVSTGSSRPKKKYLYFQIH